MPTLNIEHYVSRKVDQWATELQKLSSIADTQPHAAFAALTHGLIHKWTYLARTIPDVGHLFQPLEDTIRNRLIPALYG